MAAWLAVAGILFLFTLALTWIAVIPGPSATSADGANAFAYPLIFLWIALAWCVGILVVAYAFAVLDDPSKLSCPPGNLQQERVYTNHLKPDTRPTLPGPGGKPAGPLRAASTVDSETGFNRPRGIGESAARVLFID